MEVSQLQASRIFISSSQVPNWRYTQPCVQLEVTNESDAIKRNGLGFIPTTVASQLGLAITSFYAATPKCVDCTLTGSNVRPDFWP